MAQTTEIRATARRIVAIQHTLNKRLDTEERKMLVDAQRRLWSANFPGRSYDEILSTLH